MTLIFFFLIGAARAEVIFEGYYRIENKGEHVGFAVMREDVDPKSKVRSIRYFVHTTDRDHVTRDIMSFSTHDEKLKPLSSEYRDENEGSKSSLEIKFDGAKFEYHFDDGDSRGKKNDSLNPDEILRPVSHRALAQTKLVKGKVYAYKAVSDELGNHSIGQVRVLETQQKGSLNVYRLLDDYENNPEEIWMMNNGEVLLNRVPTHDVTSTLVKDADSAIGSLEFNRTKLANWFKEIPGGFTNSVARGKVTVSPTMFKGKVDTKQKQFPDAIPIRTWATVSK